MEDGNCDMERPSVSLFMNCHTNCVDRHRVLLMDGYAVVGVSEAHQVEAEIHVRQRASRLRVCQHEHHVFAFCQQHINQFFGVETFQGYHIQDLAARNMMHIAQRRW
jgi:hypothetical protein